MKLNVYTHTHTHTHTHTQNHCNAVTEILNTGNSDKFITLHNQWLTQGRD